MERASKGAKAPLSGTSAFTIYKGFMRNNFPRGDDSFADEGERQRDKEKSRRKKAVLGSAIIATGAIHFRILIRKYEELIGYGS